MFFFFQMSVLSENFQRFYQRLSDKFDDKINNSSSAVTLVLKVM